MISRRSLPARVPPVGTGGQAGLDFARQRFTMRNHVVEILLHPWRRSICLEPTGSRCRNTVVRGRLF
jgi:hypothetical protein